MKAIKVVHFLRKPRKVGNYSVETYYQLIRQNISKNIFIKPFVSKFESNGLFKRLYNIIEAGFNQKDVNHITGDVHFLSLFMRKGKTILTVLDCGILKETKGWKRRIIKLIWFDLPIKRVKHIIAISEATRNDLLNIVNCPPEKVKVIYICVSQIFKRSPKPFNEACPRILHIGTAPNKNLKCTVESLKNIPCCLVIIGKESEEEEKLLKQYDIKFEWYKNKLTEEEVYQQYMRCDILSFVSLFEGFGMPIIEANATGRAVICGSNSSMPEIAGEAALLVDAESVEDIKTGYLKIIKDERFRNSLIEKGFENANRFSIKNVVQQHEMLYADVYASGG